jgi:hypothetical protein
MTYPAPAAAQRREKRAFRIDPAPGTPLDDLMNQRDAAKARLDAAQKDYDSVDADIKNLTTMAVPEGTERIVIGASPSRPQMTLTWHAGTWYAPVQWLKDNAPATWDACRKQGKGYWGWGKAGS